MRVKTQASKRCCPRYEILKEIWIRRHEQGLRTRSFPGGGWAGSHTLTRVGAAPTAAASSRRQNTQRPSAGGGPAPGGPRAARASWLGPAARLMP